MFEKLRAKFSKAEIYVPEDPAEAELFDPGYKPSVDSPANVPGHPAVIHNGN